MWLRSRINSMIIVRLRCPHRGLVWQMEDSLIIWATLCTSSKILKWCKNSRVLRITSEVSIEQIQPLNHLALKSHPSTLEELNRAFQEGSTDNMFYQTRCIKMPSLRELAKDTPHRTWEEVSSLTPVFPTWTRWDSVRNLTRGQEPTCLISRESLTSKYSWRSLSHTFMTQTIAEISLQLKPLNKCLLRVAVTCRHWISSTQATFLR